MMLGTYGVNKELLENMNRLENQICTLKDMVKTSLDDARNVMTTALTGALKKQLNQHEKEHHNFGEFLNDRYINHNFFRKKLN